MTGSPDAPDSTESQIDRFIPNHPLFLIFPVLSFLPNFPECPMFPELHKFPGAPNSPLSPIIQFLPNTI